MSKPDNPGQAFLAELERDAHRFAEEAEEAWVDQEFFERADDEDLRHETANTGQLLEIAEDDGDTEKAATLARSYERHLAEQRRRAVATQPPEPPVGTVLETSGVVDDNLYRIERTAQGWQQQYRDGEDEYGRRLHPTTISWRAAWSAWGPPNGAEPFREVAPDEAPLPALPPTSTSDIGPDASDGHLDPPPAAEPYDPLADAKRAEKAAADADDEWDRNPNPQTAQASRDAGQAADEAWRRAGRPDCIPPAPTASTDATNKGPDLSDLRTGRWYDTDPITNTGSPGGAMSGSIDDVRAGIAAANESANEGLGALQQAHASLESAQGMLLRATEGSSQADVSTTNGMLAQALSGIEESRQQICAAIQGGEDVAARL